MRYILSKGILIAMVLLGVFGLSACKASTAVEADFELGYDGVVKISEGNPPLSAKINNMGQGFIGELQIEIEKDGRSIVIFAKEFEIASSSEKEITMHTPPVYMIQKAFKVNIVSEGREVYSEKIVPKQFISPDHTVIAVITDQADNYRFFSNLTLPKYNINQEFMSSYQYSVSSPIMSSKPMAVSSTMVETATEVTKKTHVLYFDDFSQFKEKVNYDFMDYIYIGGDSSNLNMTQDVALYLEDWMNNGNTLFVETGGDFKKVMNQLPESFINYDIVGTETTTIEETYSGGVDIDETFEAVIGDVNAEVGGDYLVIEDFNYGVVTAFGAGQLVTLRMDFGDAPFDTHGGTTNLINDIVTMISDKEAFYEDEHYYGYYDMTYRLSRIPDDKAPPYALMVFIFLLYTAIVGPVMYAVFKRMDKRDYLWVAIPAASLICIIVLYLVGFATRYNKPITNAISSIEYTEGKEYFEVTTDIALFNNDNDDVTIAWSEDEDIKFTSNNDYYYRGDAEQAKKVIGKMMVGKNKRYTVYDSPPLWTPPSYMHGSKVIPFETDDKAMVKMSMVEEAMTFEVHNSTPLNLEYAFLMFGNTLYKIGDFEAGSTLTLDKGFTGDVYQFFDTEMVPNLYNDYTPEGRKRQADIEVLREKAENQFYAIREGRSNLSGDAVIYGMNRDPIGYNININDEETEDYSRNVVMYNGQVTYEKGETIKLGHGTIETDYSYDEFGRGHMYVYNDYNYGMVADIYELDTFTFEWQIPEFMTIETLELKVDPVYNQELFHNVYGGYGAGEPEKAIFELYNVRTGRLEEIDFDDSNLSTILDLDIEDYTDNGRLMVQVTILGPNGKSEGNFKEYGDMMVLPTISVKGGVVK